MDPIANDADLLAQYVAAFKKQDGLSESSVPKYLRDGRDRYGWVLWRPRQIVTQASALEAVYQGIGLPDDGSIRFPPLYETLLLSYRWAKVELGDYSLLANEPAKDLSPLLAEIKADNALFATLIPAGYYQFGRGPGADYDPVCFDFRHRHEDGDCRIVKTDH